MQDRKDAMKKLLEERKAKLKAIQANFHNLRRKLHMEIMEKKEGLKQEVKTLKKEMKVIKKANQMDRKELLKKFPPSRRNLKSGPLKNPKP